MNCQIVWAFFGDFIKNKVGGFFYQSKTFFLIFLTMQRRVLIQISTALTKVVTPHQEVTLPRQRS